MRLDTLESSATDEAEGPDDEITRLETAVRSFQKGDDPDKSFRTIFDHCYPAVTRYFAKKRVPFEECHDLAQNTLIHVYDNLKEFRFECPFMAWVWRIAYHDFLKWWRQRRQVETHQSLDDSDAGTSREIRALEDPSPSADERVDREKLMRLIRDSIRLLPTRKRLCLELFYLQERPYKEIADILGITTGAVGAHINFARKQLKKDLEGHVYIDELFTTPAASSEAIRQQPEEIDPDASIEVKP